MVKHRKRSKCTVTEANASVFWRLLKIEFAKRRFSIISVFTLGVCWDSYLATLAPVDSNLDAATLANDNPRSSTLFVSCSAVKPRSPLASV